MTDEGRDRARRAVRKRREELRLSQEVLAARAGIGKGTVKGLEAVGGTWPIKQNLAGLEAALDWPPGAIERIAAGEEPPEPVTHSADPVPGQVATGDHSTAAGIPVSELSRLVPLLPEGWDRGMSPSEAAEALAAGLSEVLARARQIRQDRARAEEEAH